MLMTLTIQCLFSQVREVACTSELASFAGSSIAAGRASHAGQVVCDMTDCLGWGLGVGPTSLLCKNCVVLKP